MMAETKIEFLVSWYQNADRIPMDPVVDAGTRS